LEKNRIGLSGKRPGPICRELTMDEFLPLA
jgi:hypothetical protein